MYSFHAGDDWAILNKNCFVVSMCYLVGKLYYRMTDVWQQKKSHPVRGGRGQKRLKVYAASNLKI